MVSVLALAAGTERVNVATSGAQANATGAFDRASLSANGRFAAFSPLASNLAQGDTNGRHDIFVRDRELGRTNRVSVGTGGAQANGDSYNPNVSADGGAVIFESSASNPVSGDTKGRPDVFVRTR
jgi:Tol biopolymer transport system component